MPVISTEIIEDDELEQYEFPQKRKIHMYVDNNKLTEEMLKWVTKIEAAKVAGEERPRMPEFVGKCVHDIAENLAKKGNFNNYSWVDLMIGDGIEACCAYLHNYRHDAVTRKSKPNPYGYISKIIEQAFKHRIEIENRQLYYKNKSLELLGGVEAFENEDWGEAAEATNNMMKDMVNRAHEYEEKQAKRALEEKEKQDKLKPAKLTLLEIFGEPV